MGDPSKSLLPYYRNARVGIGFYKFYSVVFSGGLVLLLSRIGWVPYIMAYDWLGFKRVLLEGKLTLGRSIGFASVVWRAEDAVRKNGVRV